MIKIHHVFAGIFFITALIACGPDSKKSVKRELSSDKTEKNVSSKKQLEKNQVKSIKAKTVPSEPSMSTEQIAVAKEIIESVSPSEIEKVDVQKLFKMHCAICHGFKGNMTVNGAKDLTKSKLPLHESVAQVYFGKGLMTPYKNILKDNEIVAISKFITTLR